MKPVSSAAADFAFLTGTEVSVADSDGLFLGHSAFNKKDRLNESHYKLCQTYINKTEYAVRISQPQS